MSIEPLSLMPTHPALPPAIPTLRRAAALALHRGSITLHVLAQRLAPAPAHHAHGAAAPVLEFHAEAGAPEGALYVDGRLVAHLAGVSRL